MKIIKINSPFITLGQLLKYTNIIQNGGEVKFYLMENDVFINGVLDVRRGKKIYPGDIVKIKPDITLKIESKL